MRVIRLSGHEGYAPKSFRWRHPALRHEQITTTVIYARVRDEAPENWVLLATDGTAQTIRERLVDKFPERGLCLLLKCV